jgi:hypothetical protein
MLTFDKINYRICEVKKKKQGEKWKLRLKKNSTPWKRLKRFAGEMTTGKGQ